MKALRLMAVFATSATFAMTGLAAPPGIRTVYILPMAGGLDQYLATWLTRDHVLEVVADPKLADAVMTDSLGESFEQKMTQIRPPEPVDSAKDAAVKDDNRAGAGSSAVHTFRSTRSKGTLFLVDAKTRIVVWSDYEKAPNLTTNQNLNREAQRVVRKLSDNASDKPADKTAH